MTDPITVLNAIGNDVEALDQVGKDLDTALNALTIAEEAWERHYDPIAEKMANDAALVGERVPGEELRIQRARLEGDGRVLWNAVRKGKRNVEKFQKRQRRLEAQLSARQSELNALKSEQRGAGQGIHRAGHTFGRAA